METIKSYLEAMFANMPNTEAVRKAKSELLQMMEDKYNELIEEGQSENTAVGTVISEFGNLDELADDLGLAQEVEQEHIEYEMEPRRQIIMDEAKDYLLAKKNNGLLVAMGVMLCIMSVTGPIVTDAFNLPDSIGVLLMFSMVAIAVGLFVYGGIIFGKWDYIKKEACQIDMNTASFLDEEYRNYGTTHALRLTIGIVLCAVCWLPAAVLSDISDYLDNFGAVLLFIMVGIGVFLIVYTSNIKGSYEDLLKINDPSRISGKYVKSQEEIQWINDGARLVMEIYWSAITCIYLIWSFVTFRWYISWIIWPIASIIYGILKTGLRKRNTEV